MSKHLQRRFLLKVLLALLLSASAAPASAQSTQVDEKPADSMRGVVVNSVTNEPIGRALVSSSDNRFATMTNSEGRFELILSQPEADKNANNESGSANQISPRDRTYPPLTARKPGFLSDRMSQRMESVTSSGVELTISLTPEALVVGRVVLPTSEPSDTIDLELYRRQVQEGRAHWIRAGSASTRSNGEFRIADLSPGTYKLLTRELLDRDPLTFDPRGQLYGYPPVYFPNATDFAAAQSIELTAGQIFQADISLVRHAYYQVKVPVMSAGANVHGVGIVVSAQGHRGPGFALGYNDQDQMIEGLLPNGNYTLEASSFGPTVASGVVSISVKGAAVEGPHLTLVPNGAIGVNVKEEFTATEDPGSQGVVVRNGHGGNANRPRRYLNIRLEPADDFGQERGAGLRPPTGPDDESLIIEGVQPGRYWVRVDTARGFVAGVSSGTTDLNHHPLVVGPGGSSLPIEITLRDDTAELEGAIEGAPTPGISAASPTQGPISPEAFAHVYCVPLPDSSGQFREITVSADGNFSPETMPPGTYRVLAFDQPQPELEYRDPEAMRAYEAKGLLVRLVAGQKEHVQLPLISNSGQP